MRCWQVQSEEVGGKFQFNKLGREASNINFGSSSRLSGVDIKV